MRAVTHWMNALTTLSGTLARALRRFEGDAGKPAKHREGSA
jgi:hypothetical protein